MQALTLVALPGMYSVSRLLASQPIPAWAIRGDFVSITRDCETDELSIVCPEQDVAHDVKSERGWRCLWVTGPLDFQLVGVLAGLVNPLARAGIPVFVISSFDTDYVLIKAENLEMAVTVLGEAGHRLDITAPAEER